MTRPRGRGAVDADAAHGPLVTVVIPHYNYGAFLPTAVQSALTQDGVRVEVIVVDDRSTDGSLDTARALAADDARITLVEHDINLRHIATYNDGLSRARGDYVVLLSADDALAPGALARAVSVMVAHPEVVLVYGRVEWFDDDLPAPSGGKATTTVWTGRDWIRLLSRRGRNAIVNPEVVMRRDAFIAAGAYDAELTHSADMYLWLRAAARGSIGRVNGPTQAYYRDHGANMHVQDYGGVLDDTIAVRRTFEKFFAADGSLLRRPGALERRARRSVAREALVRGVSLIHQGAPADALHGLRDFAVDTDAGVRRTATWWWSGFTLGSVAHPWRRRLIGGVERLRWSIRWQLLDRRGR
ncbi:MAG: glycosyltransferase [Microbacterium sp.]|uniref:glycosyltransferase n=1 Tax=Microbacterium sp. TaxID=51671 RepID=UPI002608D807|nr:glycosyltransferase [Microbacterium sp.]MCX6502864.1 glycosyltransferase [Microbacterium sp.]